MKFTLILISCWLVSFSLVAQKVQYKFENYSVRDGLSQSTVYSILQDSTGYIWAGTRDGLNRFDGHTFKVFQPKDGQNTLTERTVRALVNGSGSELWLGTDGGGVVKYNPKENQFYSICTYMKTSCNEALNILSLVYQDSILWAGTRENGLISYDLRLSKHQKLMEGETVWVLEFGSDNVLYAGTSMGGFRIQGDDAYPFLTGLVVYSLYFDENSKHLWVGTENKGVKVFDSNLNQVINSYKSLNQIQTRSINTIAKGPDNRIWLGSSSSGIFVFNPDNGSVDRISADINNGQSLSENNIRSFYKDRTGVFWIGTNTSGISNYSQHRYIFSHFGDFENGDSFSGTVVLSFEELQSGEILIGTERNGLSRFSPKNSRYTKVDFLEQTTVVSLMEDSKNKLWIGSDGAGLFLIDAGEYPDFDNHEVIENLSDPSILSLMEMDEQTFLVGTYQGLNWIKDRKVVKHAFSETGEPDMLQDDRILALYKENEEDFWVGTYAGGLSFYNASEQMFTTYKMNQQQGSISSNRVQVIHKDQKGNLWIGTSNGLNLFESSKKRFEVFKKDDGLPSDVIYGILEDQSGYLWLSTNNGLSRFNPETGVFKNYTVADGLQSNEFNGGAYLKTSSGLMYFGGIEGFNILDPDYLPENTLNFNTVITGFSVEGDRIEFRRSGDNHSFGYQSNYFLFEFSSLEYSKPDKHEFRYKLSGFDDEWVNIGKNRSVNFSGLPPGSYQFIVKGTNGDGKWGIPSQPLQFSITPPFWQTNIFRFSAFIVLFGIIYVAYRYRTYYLLREERTRNRIARDLHDDLSATLSSISFFSEAAKRIHAQEGGKPNQFLQKIDESANEAKEKINDIIWAIDPTNDDWSVFLKKCKRFAADALDSKEIKYTFDIDDNLDIPVRLEVRQNLWLIFKETINNMVKHAQASQAYVRLGRNRNQIVLEISDNGIGFEASQEKTGHGLNNLYYRTEQIKGKVSLETSPGKGTKWQFIFEV
ncbi:ligand-binding sensor domain-containing protein [Gracilimonas sp.]|uniref:ligand-binding sensor domain-containing protein n=1 Tax=Gracilimonas sp. TaxID=1974203 RepID=UPI003BAD44BE